jgi:hypothetical protein
MPENPQQQRSDPRVAFNVVYLLANARATCLTVFMRHSFGVEAIGMSGLHALVLIVLVGGFGRSPEMLQCFLPLWIYALLWQRVYTLKRVRTGARWHSRFQGYPALAMRIPLVRREKDAVTVIEPALCFLVGMLLREFSPVMGGFVFAGGFSLLVRHGIDTEINRKRLQAMQDAELEQRWLAERFRGRTDDY